MGCEVWSFMLLEYVMDQFLKRFEVKNIHEGKFKFCGREYEQVEDDSIRITCTNYLHLDRPVLGRHKPRRVKEARSGASMAAYKGSRACAG